MCLQEAKTEMEVKEVLHKLNLLGNRESSVSLILVFIGSNS